MDNKYFDSVIAEIKPFFDENGIAEKDGLYCNENKAISIKYDDNRKMFVLSLAEISQGNIGDFAEINAWLFDDTHTERDAVSVGMDFTNSLRKEFGITRQRAANAIVDLPTASKDGSVNMSSFTKKVLDVFPALKDEYKAHITVYGNFLHINFFGEHLVPRVIRLFEEGTKKQIKKFYNIIEDGYNKGDKDTVNAIVFVLAAAAYNNEKVTDGIIEMLAENKHFLDSFRNFVPVFAKNTKIKNIIIKE